MNQHCFDFSAGWRIPRREVTLNRVGVVVVASCNHVGKRLAVVDGEGVDFLGGRDLPPQEVLKAVTSDLTGVDLSEQFLELGRRRGIRGPASGTRLTHRGPPYVERNKATVCSLSNHYSITGLFCQNDNILSCFKNKSDFFSVEKSDFLAHLLPYKLDFFDFDPKVVAVYANRYGFSPVAGNVEFGS